jgi:hypothetical protein
MSYMRRWFNLSHHHHSGRLKPHEHTSYLPLGILLLVVGLALTGYTALAATPYDGPEAGSIGITGIMPGKPPTVAASIQTPTDGQRFSETPITVTGTCPQDTLVELFKNDIFAGSTTCTERGTYSLQIDLMNGQNILIARVYDALNQPGPDSNPIVVIYDGLPPQADPLNSLEFGGAQLLLNTDAVFRGIFPDKEMAVPIDILGGTPPYAINVQWGDSNNKVIPRNDNVTFNATHVYAKPGTYQISLQASDAAGRVAFLTVAAIVNGQPPINATGATNTSNNVITTQLLALWPLYAIAVTSVVSFWVGERREKQILAKHGMLITS